MKPSRTSFRVTPLTAKPTGHVTRDALNRDRGLRMAVEVAPDADARWDESMATSMCSPLLPSRSLSRT